MFEGYVIRPGKVYLVVGIGALSACIIMGICVLVQKEEVFTTVYLIMYLPLLSILGLCTLVFYFRKKIILGNEEFVIRPVIGKTKKWRYSEVSLVEIYSNQGLSRPIALFAGQKRLVKIVSAYSGYFVFERIFEEKCGHVMNYC